MTALVVAPRTEACGERCRGLHSYVADGRRLCWRPTASVRAAVDAEIATQPLPERLARGRDADAFWRAWTRAEALAKLTDTPIAVWLRRHGLDAPAPDGVRLRHHRIGDLVICTAQEAA